MRGNGSRSRSTDRRPDEGGGPSVGSPDLVPGQSFEPGPGLYQVVAFLSRLWGGSRSRRVWLLAAGVVLAALVVLFAFSLLLLVTGD